MNELRKIIISSDFNDKINDLQKSRMSFLSNQPNQSNFDFTYDTFPPNGKITLAEEFKPFDLEPKVGSTAVNKYQIGAYDESTWDFFSLQGELYFTAHALAFIDEKDYIPQCFITNYCLTRSRLLSKKSDYIQHAQDVKEKSSV